MNPKQYQDEYSTPISERSVGGLVICGINFGGDENNSANVKYCKPFVAQAEEDNFPFHRRILDWFAMWGCDLRGDMASEADRLSHTNYFMDQSVAQKKRTNEGWRGGISALRVAGCGIGAGRPFLICSPAILHGANWASEKLAGTPAAAQWRDLVGEPYWLEDHTFGEGKTPFRAMFMRRPDGGSRVAAITHTAARGITSESVRMAVPVMKSWLASVWHDARARKVPLN